MNHGEMIKFEAGVDDFVGHLKSELRRNALQLKKVSVPQCLATYRVSNLEMQAHLRLVLLGYPNGEPIARVSWLGSSGEERTCCYVNDVFEAITLKSNGRWVRSKRNPKETCLRELAHLLDGS
ncbi:hypothetical protein [Marinomonas mediterranea]|jgi:hypothetical protein|uniref:Uncharacterized protein n=1 Tax=Marinomonas mediterranea (strain ATCC 700492 / JCM 21426 / NBRC 103028 / MMB-1) TaxID=717774 RepID=F2K4V5_MARM1|nr:hypothetical protein [Marinomonas mediterranea]ADZ92598.1 hypothetical protein Marme_3382 [Marinomonas mediterranea MMB-1]WCN10540.1 hypothetical protein GV055_17230 [Marinomonas mediterranea]WCN14589.1 hypothetical protein GV054_17055 [Marinomonas mediterranea]WCN18637.1 hypothetical protein GV053_17120 [Marinomonas mediterranea MMB-1]